MRVFVCVWFIVLSVEFVFELVGKGSLRVDIMYEVNLVKNFFIWLILSFLIIELIVFVWLFGVGYVMIRWVYIDNGVFL